METKAYWVGFNHVKGIGSVRMRYLFDYFGDLSLAWQAPVDALKSAGLPEKVIEHLTRTRQQLDLEQLLDKIIHQGIKIITWEEPEYPPLLKQIDQPPPVLYVKGEINRQDEWSIAIVGTRRITAYGRQVTGELSRFLAQNGITVVSGLARGVDSVAHEACLANGGRTIGILGSGVDRIYPPEHTALAERIMQQGAIVSDYAPGTPPDGVNFPPRNRIISGLSLATIVVEAGEGSGALITANFAAEQGRDVFAVPGNIYAPQSRGTNRLIQQGGRPLMDFSEILESIHLKHAPQQQSLRLVLPADEVEADIMGNLSHEPMHIDEIKQVCGLPIDKVSATLAMMELKGMVRHVGGMNYVLVREMTSEYRINQDD